MTMRRTHENLFQILLLQNGWILIAAFFFLVAGISCGSFTEVLMTTDQKVRLTQYISTYLSAGDLGNTDYQEIFIGSLKNNILLLALMAISGMTAFGFPAALLLLSYKGMTIGFSSALLIENMEPSGTALMFVSMIPQNLIILPVLSVAAVISVNFAFLILGNGFSNIKRNLAFYAGSYLLLQSLLCLGLIFGAAIEAFICPILTKLIL